MQYAPGRYISVLIYLKFIHNIFAMSLKYLISVYLLYFSHKMRLEYIYQLSHTCNDIEVFYICIPIIF